MAQSNPQYDVSRIGQLEGEIRQQQGRKSGRKPNRNNKRK
jgi:hypothetical protein